MIKKLPKTIFGAVLLATVNYANAGPNPYTDCGIGAALFPDTHWAAVTSNVIWDAGTTAVTSATASPETCSGSEAEAAAFIYETYDSLVEDTAKGSGEHLSALLNILDVEASERENTINSLRQAMLENLLDPSYDGFDRVTKSIQYYEELSKLI